MTANIEEFTASVEKIADEQGDIILSNSGKDKAAVVLSNIFRTTENSLKIFANKLDNDVCGQPNYLTELENCINRIGYNNVYVLLENDPLPTSSAYILLKRHNIAIKKISNKSEFFKKFKDESINFTVGDKRMFRLETDTVNYKALFCFKEVGISKQLTQIFEDNYTANSVVLP